MKNVLSFVWEVVSLRYPWDIQRKTSGMQLNVDLNFRTDICSGDINVKAMRIKMIIDSTIGMRSPDQSLEEGRFLNEY